MLWLLVMYKLMFLVLVVDLASFILRLYVFKCFCLFWMGVLCALR